MTRREQIDLHLDSFRKLEDNWDGCHAPAISELVIETTRDYIRFLSNFFGFPEHIVPNFNGGINLYWADESFEVSVGQYGTSIDVDWSDEEFAVNWIQAQKGLQAILEVPGA